MITPKGIISIKNKLIKNSAIFLNIEGDNVTFNCKCGKTITKHKVLILTTFNLCPLCVKITTQETMKKKYGVTNPSQSEEIKEKKKKTTLKNYSVENPSQSKKILQRKKETSILNYGVDNPTQSEEVRQKMRNTNLKRYGVENALQSEEFKQKMRKTNQGRYGVEYASQSEDVKQKTKETNLAKYGKDYFTQTEKFQEKYKETMMNNYGVENGFQSEKIKDKMKETNLERYGFENPAQSEEVKQKMKETNLEKYGVEYAMQNAEIFERQKKMAFKRKEFVFPSGRIEYVQGYEPFGLNDLLHEGIPEDDLVCKSTDMPKITYTYEDKIHPYYPDIFIKSQKKFIEIKSIWTFNKDKDKNMTKLEACKQHGYNIELRIYSDDGKCLEIVQ